MSLTTIPHIPWDYRSFPKTEEEMIYSRAQRQIMSLDPGDPNAAAAEQAILQEAQVGIDALRLRKWGHLNGIVDKDLMRTLGSRPDATDNNLLLAQLIKEMSAFRKAMAI